MNMITNKNKWFLKSVFVSGSVFCVFPVLFCAVGFTSCCWSSFPAPLVGLVCFTCVLFPGIFCSVILLCLVDGLLCLTGVRLLYSPLYLLPLRLRNLLCVLLSCTSCCTWVLSNLLVTCKLVLSLSYVLAETEATLPVWEEQYRHIYSSVIVHVVWSPTWSWNRNMHGAAASVCGLMPVLCILNTFNSLTVKQFNLGLWLLNRLTVGCFVIWLCSFICIKRLKLRLKWFLSQI